MKTYVVKYRQVLSEYVLIEAESESEAQEKSERYDAEYGYNPDEIEEVDHIVLREATEDDIYLPMMEVFR